jgi:hypothetical protein
LSLGIKLQFDEHILKRLDIPPQNPKFEDFFLVCDITEKKNHATDELSKLEYQKWKLKGTSMELVETVGNEVVFAPDGNPIIIFDDSVMVEEVKVGRLVDGR